MLLIIDNAKEAREELRRKFFYDFAINTCATSLRNFESAFAKHPISAAYIPNMESVPNPIGYCRRFKAAHPEVPLIAAVPSTETKIDLDALYRVTDNIPLTPLPMIRLVEIICELQRLYTGRDHLDLCYGTLSITPYTFTVFYGGQPLELSVNAISILRYLCEQAPRPIPTAELVAATGSPDRRRTPSALSSRINELNKLSQKAIGCRMVSHVRGKGYIIGTEPRKTH